MSWSPSGGPDPERLKVNGVLLSLRRSGGTGRAVPQAAWQLCTSVCCGPPASLWSSRDRDLSLGRWGLILSEISPLLSLFWANYFNFSYINKPCQVRGWLVFPRSVDKQLNGSPGSRVFLVQMVLWVLLRSWLALGEDLSPQLWDSHSQNRRKWLQS